MSEEQRYRLRTPASARYFEEARRHLAGWHEGTGAGRRISTGIA